LSADALVKIREEEAHRAGAIMGLSRENIAFLRFEDGRLADHRRLLRDRLVDIFDKMNPKEIFAPSIIDTHPDHRVLAAIGRELAQARRDRCPLLYEYPIRFWDPRILSIRHLLELRICIVRTAEFGPRKRAAIAAYRSQVTNSTGDAGWTARQGFVRQFLQPEEIFFSFSTIIPSAE
jgi:LmbE family N-acetylglucosaminyl deacetylase